MFRVTSNNKVVGDFEKVIFVKKSQANSLIECTRSEADGIVAGGTVYALTNAEGFKEYDPATFDELDSEIEKSAELDYIRIMQGIV